MDVGGGRKPEEVADGFIKIAVENMANAIKKISVQRGYDVTRYALNCFGGAGGQHACLVADALGMTKVLIHPFSSLLSAYGMGLADIRATRQQAIEEPFGNKALASIKTIGGRLGKDVKDEVAGQGVPAAIDQSDRARAYPLCRHRHGFGRESRDARGDEVGLREGAQGAIRFHRPQERTGGRSGVGRGDRRRREVPREEARQDPRRLPSPARRTQFFSAGEWHKADVYTRDQLKIGHKVKGPAIIMEPHQTIVVEPGWQAELTAKNHLVLSRIVKLKRISAVGTKADPVMLEVFNNLFMSIAEQMGVALQNTAYSVNIKERLDFSCAVFSGEGTLVANAPHMPVHLGSMDRAVETIIRENKGRIRPGDVYAINAPYNGGTHLPDITVCTPVFDGPKKKILFWVASRGHHADVGGISPGSMSPIATNIEQEGVYMDNFKLVDRGRFREKELHEALTGATYPARNPVQNINDLKAQIAANEKGVQELRKMVVHFTMPVVQAYMKHVQDNAAESVRRVIDRLHDSEFAYPMDQGTEIKVKITVDKKKREATVDFTGTSPQQPTNFNAPEPVTRAAVLYVFRVMVDDEIPMNAGCLRPINIVIPEKSMLTPEYPAAVVAGNVETSQAVTNCLFGALKALSCAQGTMNNLNFGNNKYQYYETICSGSPAGPGFDGTDAVHTHMTNTRLTDPEILEFRYPVVLEDFHIRKGSGGQGPMESRRRHPAASSGSWKRWNAPCSPATAACGRSASKAAKPARSGENSVRRKTGSVEMLRGCDATVIDAGEAIIIQTPTAGGYGKMPA